MTRRSPREGGLPRFMATIRRGIARERSAGSEQAYADENIPIIKNMTKRKWPRRERLGRSQRAGITTTWARCRSKRCLIQRRRARWSGRWLQRRRKIKR
jgi:hypothetical protein